MFNNSFDANNNSLDAIDAEFELTTDNNTNNEETMINQQEITMTKVTGEQALAALTVANKNTEAIRVQSPVELLEQAEITKGWVAVSDAERTELAKLNQLSHREIKTSTFAWSQLTDDNLGIRLGSFANVVEPMIGKGLTNKVELEALFGKHLFDQGEVATINIVDSIFHGVLTQGNLVVEVAVDFNKGKIAYVAKHKNNSSVAIEPKVKDLRKFALISFLSADQRSNQTGLYSVEDTVRIFWALVNRCWTVDMFQRLVSETTAKLFIDTSEQQLNFVATSKKALLSQLAQLLNH